MLAELAPGGIETTIECIRNLEPGGRVALIAPNPEPLNLPLRYLMIRSIEFTSVTGASPWTSRNYYNWCRAASSTRAI